MDTNTQDNAVEGLIAFWEDIYFIQGKEYVATRLKPGIQNALKEVSPLFLSLAEGFAKYKDYENDNTHYCLPEETVSEYLCSLKSRVY